MVDDVSPLLMSIVRVRTAPTETIVSTVVRLVPVIAMVVVPVVVLVVAVVLLVSREGQRSGRSGVFHRNPHRYQLGTARS